jgi:hypothetical protein
MESNLTSGRLTFLHFTMGTSVGNTFFPVHSVVTITLYLMFCTYTPSLQLGGRRALNFNSIKLRIFFSHMNLNLSYNLF